MDRQQLAPKRRRWSGDNKDHLNESQFCRKVSSSPFLCARENPRCIICEECKCIQQGRGKEESRNRPLQLLFMITRMFL